MRKKDRIKKKFISIAFKNYAKNLKMYNQCKKFSHKQKSNMLVKQKFIAIGGNFAPLRCSDQYVAVLDINWSCIRGRKVAWEGACGLDNSNITNENERKKINDKVKKEKDCKVIALVLESPHKHEFFNNDTIRENPCPAMGTTGENIHKYFSECLFKFIPYKKDKNKSVKINNCIKMLNGKYKVVLINAIQYQCSLGKDTKTFRDKIFSEMWENKEVKDCFRTRLGSYNPDIIINCCTKGHYGDSEEDKKNYLRKKVQDEINDYCNSIIHKTILKLCGTHPSSYHFRNGFSLADD